MTFRHRAGVSPYTSPFGFAETCVFDKQLLGLLCCRLLSQALLLPKLRSLFAEFLNNASPAGLWILSSSTCVGLRYGQQILTYMTFLDSMDSSYSLLNSLRITLRHKTLCLLRCLHSRNRLSFCVITSNICQYWNFNQLSIGYDFRPHLRPRLTPSSLALPGKP